MKYDACAKESAPRRATGRLQLVEYFRRRGPERGGIFYPEGQGCRVGLNSRFLAYISFVLLSKNRSRDDLLLVLNLAIHLFIH